MNHHPLVIIGAGPAGLTAAHEAVRNGLQPLVLERTDKVGGLARTEVHRGYRFDIGGHRFFTKVAEIQQLWQSMLGDQFIEVPRLSRIYYRGRFFQYPLEPMNAFANLGPVEALRILGSYVQARLRPSAPEETYEQWVVNRFGRRLYETFFKTYTEKVWGIRCDQLRADWAAQRIRGLSLTAAVSNAFRGGGEAKTLINRFHYPLLGPGMMWERFCEVVQREGGEVRLQAPVVRLSHKGGYIVEVVTTQGGETHRIESERVISSMPLGELILCLDPPAPAEVIEAAHGLRYRDFILVGLIVGHAKPFADNWIYIHSPGVRVGRIQNFKNWSAAMTPDAECTSLGMEYFCTVGDDLWQMADSQLVELATQELEVLGLARAADVEEGIVIRQTKTYPVYDEAYAAHLAVLRRFLANLHNLQTIGRNGMHRYNNQDHSMVTGMLAVRNLLGGAYDLWQVNESAEYLEEMPSRRNAATTGTGRP